MCENSSNFDYSIVDDVSIGSFVQKYHSDIINESYKKYNAKLLFINQNSNINDVLKIPDIIFYRNRTNNRNNDVKNIQLLTNNILIH
jgi:hypothetical protein